MTTNTKLYAALIAAAAISTASTAFAQDATTAAPAMPATPESAAVAAPAMPASPTIETHNAVIAPATEEVVMPAPTAPVAEMPKADASIMEKMTNAWNSKNVDEIIAAHSKDGFIKIDPMGAMYKDTESLKKMLVEKFAGPAHTYTSTVDMVKDVAPGVAVLAGTMSAYKEGETSKAEMKMAFTATFKYEDGAWKAVASQCTMIHDETMEAKPAASGGGMGKTIALVIIGALVGFFGARFMPKKDQSAA